jgi:hypothetical protein
MKSWVLPVLALLVAACTSQPQIPHEEETEPRTDQGAEEPERAPAEPQAPVSGTEAAPPADGSRAEKPPEAIPEESFTVSEEVYNKTFDEVEGFIRNLNEIIRRCDYDTWLTYLSEEYIRHTSDPAYLHEQSEKPLLKKNNIELERLEDYFRYVVVPSRSQATIDDIEFLDENHVKAISSIRGTRGILYLLVRINGDWKIGVWE